MYIVKLLVLVVMVYVAHFLADLIHEPELFWKSMFLVLLLSNAWDIGDIKRGLK